MTLELTSVTVVLRNQPLDSTFLHHLGLVISSFLGPPRNLSLANAYSFKSTELLDWIWSCSCVSSSSRTFGSALNNYLRSEQQYYQWQFWKITQVAVELGDLKLMQWIFTHFKGCIVPVKVVEKAAKDGHQELLQFLLENDAGRYRRHRRQAVESTGEIIPYESIPEMPLKARKKGNVVHWGGNSILLAIEHKHPEVARWLYENAPHELDDEEVQNTIEFALMNGAVDLAQFLLPLNRRLVEYAFEEIHADVAMLMLNNGDWLRSQEVAAAALRAMVSVDRLDLMEQIERRYCPSPLSSTWSRAWFFGITEACKSGNVPIARWLLEHPVGREVCTAMREEGVGGKDEYLCLAASMGHFLIVVLLDELMCSFRFEEALIEAIRNGHLSVITWLLARYSYSPTSSSRCVIEEAAKHGHLEILKFFHRLRSSTEVGAVIGPWWRQSVNAMNVAAKNGHLDVVQWLHATYPDTDSSKAMDHAAANGHLAVVQWLHEVRKEECTRRAMGGAAANGHLEVLQWLHSTTFAGCSTHAMDLAAGRGHLKVLKWLRANRSEGCTVKAVENALQQSHLPILFWLRQNYPGLIPSKHKLVIQAPNQFDTLVFLHQYYPHLFNGGTAREPAIGVGFEPSETQISSWLKEKFSESTLAEGVVRPTTPRR
ncbi:putative ankyrin repeat protein [Phytophthora citrophthora]|uniref:Ankyrin repeat protein n=1 Tax=Phytophthora citrophthora TaxID=4793 RepID=A0AAD9G154_9STRA|nr:putative ankyrin repeat protein [Phytophthora citrophthora]